MKNIYITVLLLFVFSISKSQAQTSSYVFTQTTGTYSAIAGGTVLGSSDENTDDQYFIDPATPLGGAGTTGTGFPIGFVFCFNGRTYDRVGINNNGWLALGQSTSAAPFVNLGTNNYPDRTVPISIAYPGSVTAVQQNRISVLGMDLQEKTGATLRIQTIGVAPNRVLVVQWSNYILYKNGTIPYVGTDNFNFQIRLNETTNIVEFDYGVFVKDPSTTTASVPPALAEVGIRGAGSADYNNRSITTAQTWPTSVAGATNADNGRLESGGILPTNGLIYTFSPSAATAIQYITTQPVNKTTCSGISTSLTVVTNGPGLTYQWRKAGVNIVGATAATYTIASPVVADAGSYDVVVSGACGSQTSTAATLTVNAAPSATISYAGAPFCKSLVGAQPVTLTGTTGGAYSSAPAGLTLNAATGDVTPSSSTANTYTVTYTIAAAGGCAAFTTTASVTITTAPAATISYAGSPYCTSVAGAKAVTQTGTAGGTYTSAPAGLTINAASGAVTPSSSTPGIYTVTYTIAAGGGCAAFTTTASVTITAAPAATISYAGSPFCKNLVGTQAVTQTGTTGGTYTSAPAGLTLNGVTGDITPSSSTANTYTVTYTVAAAGGCAAFTTTASVTITTAPAATISYSSPSYCTTAAVQSVTQTGTGGGSYSSTAGLTINSATGAITPSSSTAGPYVVTYTIAASGGCALYTTTTNVTITAAPGATISYSSPSYCTTAAVQSVTQTGTGGGSYSSTAGLTINAATGAITPSSSTAGPYVVTYTVAASGGCALYTTTTNVTIQAAPSATISYSSPSYCTTAAVQSVTQTGTGGGSYSSTAGLTINAATGAITPSSSTAGPYVITYTVAASGSCALYTTTANVTITAAPSATISYSSPSYCTTAAVQPVTQTGTGGGTYSSTAGLTINAATGAITPSSSTAGPYVVTYTVAASGGCALYTTTTNVTITTAPSATISYSSPSYCTTAAVQSVTQTGTGGGSYSSTAGLTINAATGAITPSSSTAGPYVVTYTVAASGVCALYTTTTNVTITTAPSATISYSSPSYCTTAAVQSVTQTGTGGGSYSSTAGLTINAATGAITPSSSTAGPYVVTYTIAASGGCALYTTTTNVTITTAPSATISYAGSPYCTSLVGSQTVTQTGTGGGSYSSTAGLTINAAEGAITPSSSHAGHNVVP